MFVNTCMHIYIFRLTEYYTHLYAYIHTHTHSRSLSLSHTHTFTPTVHNTQCTHTHTHTHTHSLSLSHTHTFTPTVHNTQCTHTHTKQQTTNNILLFIQSAQNVMLTCFNGNLSVQLFYTHTRTIVTHANIH